MKICLVSDTLPGFHKIWSGAETVCVNLSDTLKMEGCEVFFLTYPFDYRIEKKDKIYELISPLRSSERTKRLLPFDPFSFLHCLAIFLRERPDLVHIHGKACFTAVAAAARLLGVKVVFSVLDYFLICLHNTLINREGEICSQVLGMACEPCKYPAQESASWVRRLAWKYSIWQRAAFKRYLSNRLDGIIALSETSRRRLIEHGIRPELISANYYYRGT